MDRSPNTRSLVVPPTVALALKALLEAHEYATCLKQGVWEFAVEAESLLGRGVTNSALRWLLCQGHARHAVETTSSGNRSRSFRTLDNLALPRGSCFVLTSSGLVLAREVFDSGRELTSQGICPGTGSPNWEPCRRQLRCGDVIVKQFRRPAANQERILDAFQEEGWPARIDDPLPGHPNRPARDRLHDTINRLNRGQRRRLIRFRGDGRGSGVVWELLPG